jgi:hypothetical protein
MRHRAVIIPYFAILEAIFFRASSALAGYAFVKTGDYAYLIICLIYLARNVWWVYCDSPNSKEEAEVYVRKKMPNIHNLTQIDPEAKRFMLTGVRISTIVCPLVPPFLYPALGYAAAFPSAEEITIATIIILIVGRIAELFHEVNSNQ